MTISKLGLSFFILLGIALFTSIILTVAKIDNSAVDRWLDKAQAAGNPAQTAEFLGYYKEGLIDKGYTPEKYYNVFRYPSTQFKVYYRVIDGLVERANDLASMKPSDTAFQMGLLNLEKDINDVGAHCHDGWIASGGVWFIVLCVTGWISVIIVGFWWGYQST